MAKQNDAPAFPTQHVANGNTVPGMTLRDWFAGQALPALFSSGIELMKAGGSATSPASIARDCYRLADAMLDERKKA